MKLLTNSWNKHISKIEAVIPSHRNHHNAKLLNPIQNYALWLKTIYFQKQIKSHHGVNVRSVDLLFDSKSTLKLVSAQHLRYLIIIQANLGSINFNSINVNSIYNSFDN